MFEDSDYALAEEVLSLASAANLKLCTAESCTGGLIIGLLTAVSGASEVVERGFVTYSNESKQELLQVPSPLLAPSGPGAVSEPVARAMAEGALANSHADLAVSVTGIAGPKSDDTQKPVGLVHFGLAMAGRETGHDRQTFGEDKNRRQIRLLTVRHALVLIKEAIADRSA